MREPWVRVDLITVVVPFPHLSAGVPHVIDALLDALAVQVEDEKEHKPDKAQHDAQEDIGRLEGQVRALAHPVTPQGHVVYA